MRLDSAIAVVSTPLPASFEFVAEAQSCGRPGPSSSRLRRTRPLSASGRPARPTQAASDAADARSEDERAEVLAVRARRSTGIWRWPSCERCWSRRHPSVLAVDDASHPAPGLSSVRETECRALGDVGKHRAHVDRADWTCGLPWRRALVRRLRLTPRRRNRHDCGGAGGRVPHFVLSQSGNPAL
jgi:hypothetical protein